MELKWLEDFLVLAREGGFSRAAALRNVTQPAFSRRIRALEHWLGVTLVDRSSMPVSLTHHGEEFLRHAKHIVDEATAVRADFRMARRADARLVRVLTLHTLSISLVPELIARFRRAQSRSRFELLSSLQGLETHFDALDEGLADILIAYGREEGGRKNANYQVTTLLHDAFMPVASQGLAAHLAAQLAAHDKPRSRIPMIAYSAFTFSHGLVSEAVARLAAENDTEIVAESTLSEAHKALALQGMGIAWLPRTTIQAELQAATLVPVFGDAFQAPIAIRATCRADLQQPAALQFWRDITGGMPELHKTGAA